MKILQNETNTTVAPNSTTTTTTTTTTTKGKEKEKEKLHHQNQQQHQQFVVEKRKAKTLKNKILQNVAQQLQQQQQQKQSQLLLSATIAKESFRALPAAIAMTDEISAITTSSTITTADSSERKTALNSNNLDKTSKDNCHSSKNNGIENINNIKNCSSNNNSGNNNDSSSSNNNNNNNNSSSSSSSDFIIAEAAKILLKNGLNGSNAAAAAAVATATATLLTAAANFQLPHQQQQETKSQQSTSSSSTTTYTSATQLKSPSKTESATTAAAAAHAQLVAIAAAAAAVNATNNKRVAAQSPTNSNTNHSSKSCPPPSQQLNNGTVSVASSTEPSSPHFATPFKSSNNSLCSNAKVATTMSSMDTGVIDYTINSASNNINNESSNSLTTSSASAVINLSTSSHANSHQKYNNSNFPHHGNRCDIGRPPISSHSSHSSLNNHNHNHVASSGTAGNFGGRLQFFKDGKFILELARSKDGEKSCWVSVPRKVFRAPSAATSSTITPSVTATASAASIPTALTVPSPTAVASIAGVGGYPKNECSNSLSYSDDNSSLQSSPWQRDHRWKQAAPRKNISKEMSHFYHKPACRKLTVNALLLTQKKRRKPLNTNTLEISVAFWTKRNILKDKSIIEIKEETKTKEKQNDDDNNKKEEGEGEFENGGDGRINNISDESEGAKENNESDDDKLAKSNNDCSDVEMSKLPSPIKKESQPDGSVELNNDVKPTEADEVEKMNTSDCDAHVDDPHKSPLNGSVSKQESPNQKDSEKPEKETVICIKKQGDEEKRLTKKDTIKSRAKLTSIVQKLMDASASRIAATAHHIFKASANSGLIQSPSDGGLPFTANSPSPVSAVEGTKHQHQISKVSPPSNTAASRLVEYHQQHVSPRKRILREFEKVSLEDTTAAAGGKRSRAKGTNSAGTIASHGLTSPLNRTSSEGGVSYNNNNNNTTNVGTHAKNNTTTTTTTAPPTKLYSSYSIHSLLGNGSSNSSSESPTASSSKRSVDTPATITSNSLAYSAYNSSSSNMHHNSNQSPKSPERSNIVSGGKSPSNSASKQKRSPPYSSPLRETHSRSPTVNATTSANYDYGRRSPRVSTEAYNKMKYPGGTESNGSPNHYHHFTQNYYAQYMASPHYVPPMGTSRALSPSTSGGCASASNTTSSSRSPRHHSSAFRATTPTSLTMTALAGATNATQNIPTTQRGDLSPQRSATASPRETTPRTVPKKTASIRRQFASPTSISTSATNANNTNSSCTSPSIYAENRNEENDRRTPVSHHQHQHQHQQQQQQQQQQQHSLLQRASPSSSNMQNSALNPYSYMYATNSPHPQNATHPVSAVSPTSVNVSAAAAAAAAAAASYIPAVVSSPYYHPYISTLAAMRHPQMWMQHYQNAAVAAANPALLQASRHPTMLSAAGAAAAAARLSPPYHGYQYNGVSNAAALAAAAAAAGFGSSAAVSPSHHSAGGALTPSGSIFNPMMHNLVASHSGAIHAPAGLAPVSSAANPMTDSNNTTDLSKASKNNNFSSSSSSSSLASSSPLPGTGISTGSSLANSIYPISNKDEQSSDVPLNLSKH